MKISHRERVVKTLNHEETDRVPIDLGGRVASMTDGAYYQLKNYLKIEGGAEEINEWYTVDVLDERILEKFDIDLRRIFLRGGRYVSSPNPDGTFVNEWGIKQKRVNQKDGHYAEMISTPLKGASFEEIDKHPWPDPYDPLRVKGLKEKVEDLFYNTDYAISAGTVGGGLLEYALWLRGTDEFLIDMMLNKKFAVGLIERIYEVQKGFYEVFLDVVGKYVQMIETHDDYGMQTGLMISPALYREIIKPYYVQLVKFIKSKTNAKIFLHSCGSLVDLIDELIDAGVDVLNPIQPAAAGMGDPGALKKRFGKRICFHGGIDEQYILPQGGPKDVEEEVKKRIRGFAPGGGYILAASHNIQVDTPPENVIAMFEAARKYGGYPITL